MKRRIFLGMTLIETVLSMWIFGIVVLSVMSMSVGRINRNSQAKLTALSIARSEFERYRCSLELNEGTTNSYGLVIARRSSRVVKYKRNNVGSAGGFSADSSAGEPKDQIRGKLCDFDSNLFKNLSDRSNKLSVFKSALVEALGSSSSEAWDGFNLFFVRVEVGGADAVGELSNLDVRVSVDWIERTGSGEAKRAWLDLAGETLSSRPVNIH